jgi:hypothetical protein
VNAHKGNLLFPESVIDVYCGDNYDVGDKKAGSICKKQKWNPRKGKMETVYPFATTWVDRGTFWNNYYMVLCPRFFAEKDSLFRTLAKMNIGDIDKNNASAYKFTW